jgi:ATP-dependent 26S proteasome regulatory subunit
LRTAKEFQAELRQLIRARFPLIHIETLEEDRVLRVVASLAQELEQKVLVWSTSRGVFRADGNELTVRDMPATGVTSSKSQAALADLAGALEIFEKACTEKRHHPTGYVFVLLDPYPYLTDRNSNPIYRRRLRDFAMDIRVKGWLGNVVIISPSSNVPLELEKEVTIIDFPLPSREEVHHHIGAFFEKIRKNPVVRVQDEGTLLEELVDASIGLTMVEIDNALARAVIDDRAIDRSDVAKIFQQKRQIIRKSGILEYVDTRNLTLDQVGGLDVLKGWLEIRDTAFSAEGRKFGIDAPKGVLVTGISGCGKSWSAKCVAASWRLPLIRLDIGKVFSSLVGSSEERMRDAIRTCEAVAPCVLWIDEIEKSLPRIRGTVGDSGVSLRVLASFLTWMQEKTAPVFVFATANEIDQLPPEMLRKGRFDEIFFVDLPTSREREEILNIHIRRLGRKPESLDVKRLAALSGPESLG